MISTVGVQAGTLVDGVITFPEKAFYMAMADYNSGNWSFYGNVNGAFKLVLPGATDSSAAAAPAKKKISHRSINKSVKLFAVKKVVKSNLKNEKPVVLK